MKNVRFLLVLGLFAVMGAALLADQPQGGGAQGPPAPAGADGGRGGPGRGLEGAIRALKAERDGEIEVAGPALAQRLTELGLIDEYRISTCTPSCLVTASHTSSDPGRRSALWLMIGLARM